MKRESLKKMVSAGWLVAGSLLCNLVAQAYIITGDLSGLVLGELVSFILIGRGIYVLLLEV